MAKQIKNGVRDERLQVEDSILLLKNTLASHAGHCIRNERLQVEDSILFF